MISQTEKNYTLEEYLELEANSEERHEYMDGETILMPGGLPNHNRIAGNFYAALNFALKRQPYDVFITDQRLWIPRKRIYTYPDVMIIQGELQLQEGRRDTLTNPIMIAEVLSNSTEAYDRSGKFAAYRTIPSFQEYVLIDQYDRHVEQYYKTEPRKWIFSEYDGAEAILSLNSVPFEIALADLYDKVDFEAE
ncbi:Uma2 family endonuclease [Phormidesmis priestleyi ULC007]|uniref:Uma2 family endonuclease n=1 Tax=Phormidesmis priestleyi ULC007 TaxID=1920490 RepID=A0A2T1DGP6_9CYAN|nr:Uma2 family endonuclease [Phormidesmis priestleyi]PSB19643.1 Uma2 family endonuclease [Phormidesmis priestleyi ULC007]PZO53527.1 MAG: Uma2 family endonuclease [Phormidesmis priestleyi]